MGEDDADGASGTAGGSAANTNDRARELDVVTPSAQPGPTLLPGPIAQAVSLATRSTSLALRFGTVLGSYGFDAAKVTTLSSLDLGRGVIESLLFRAGGELSLRSRTQLERQDAETVLERSLENLHHAMTQVVFWTNTGFLATGSALSMVSDTGQLVLSSLDQLFGSTDSSRAIASIITLIRREFRNPSTGTPGERVGVLDLFLALCALAYLQKWCWRLGSEQNRRAAMEEAVWDIVVLEDGERIDVHDKALYGSHSRSHSREASRDLDLGSAIRVISETNGRSGAVHSDDKGDDRSERLLKESIVRSMPVGAEVSIETKVSTTRTITVSLHGPKPTSLALPPGVQLVEERPMNQASEATVESGNGRGPAARIRPGYRLVYKMNRNKSSSTTYEKVVEPQPVLLKTPSAEIAAPELDSGDSESTSSSSEDERPPVPPKTLLLDDEPTPQPLATRPETSIESPSGAEELARSFSPTTSLKHKFPSSLPRATTPRSAPRVEARSVSEPSPPKLRELNQAGPSSRPAPHLATKLLPKKSKYSIQGESKPTEKKGGLRGALKRGGGSSLSNLLGGQQDRTSGKSEPSRAHHSTPQPVVLQENQNPNRDHASTSKSQARPGKIPTPIRPAGIAKSHMAAGQVHEAVTRSPSRNSVISVREKRRDSIETLTDTYSVHTIEGGRSVSPVFVRTEVNPGQRQQGEDLLSVPPSPGRGHVRNRSRGLATPSFYSIPSGTQSSLVLSSFHHRSAYSDEDALRALRRDGIVEGIFPRHSMLRNITRYMSFSSAAYGSSFLNVLGISKSTPAPSTMDANAHHDVRAFARHTDCPTDSILLASFVDPNGGSDSSGSTETGVPLVHYISLDHESKAVVLACRGTLGFEDVLADMTCDYDDLRWRGRLYQVHKGVHASARRLLYGGDGRVLVTLKEALDEFSDYGLILCGHSLGGAVTALLGIMLADPSPYGKGFVTSPEPHLDGPGGSSESASPPHICLPAGRPIHVYTYGPPGTMSASLRRASRGLISSVALGNDIVPCLSLGVLRDFQAMALSLKGGQKEIKKEIRQRVLQAFQSGIADKWYQNLPKGQRDAAEEEWSLAALATLRSSMTNQKLLPPGDVFIVETSRVLRRDAFLLSGEDHIGRPARRIVLKYVKDVETRFQEIRFGKSMFLDHSPATYEGALNMLRRGVES